MNSILEEKGRKLFQPMPMRDDLTPCHFTMDTTCILDLLWEEEGIKNMRKNMMNLKDVIWGKFFRIKKRCFRQRDYRFGHFIHTDGVSISLTLFHKDYEKKDKYKKKDSEEDEDEEVEDTNDEDACLRYVHDLSPEQLAYILSLNPTYVGLDPGVRNIVFLSDGSITHNRKARKLRLTSPQFYTESKSKRNRRILASQMKKSEAK
jgi:hypothetical protein